MNKFIRTLLLSLALLIFIPSAGILAQDDSSLTDAPVIGDADSPALEVVQSYLASHDDAYLASDVTLFDRTYLTPLSGAVTVANEERVFFGQTFTDITIDATRYVVTEDTVVAEYIFFGTNTGPYIGIPATGTTVSLPIVDIYQVDSNLITSINRYYDSADLRGQLGLAFYGVGAYPPVTSIAPAGEAFLNVDDLAENPSTYVGQEVTVQGKIGEMIDPTAFYFWDEDLIDFDQERVVVISRTQDAFENFYPVNDTTARVIGTVTDLTVAEIAGEVDYNLDEESLVGVESNVIVIADTLDNVEPVETIPQIEDHPQAFLGKTVTLEGTIGSTIDDHSFVFYDDQLIGIAGSVLAIDTHADPMDFAAREGERIRATGVIWENNLVAISNEYELGLDTDAWEDYTERPVFAITDFAVID